MAQLLMNQKPFYPRSVINHLIKYSNANTARLVDRKNHFSIPIPVSPPKLYAVIPYQSQGNELFRNTP